MTEIAWQPLTGPAVRAAASTPRLGFAGVGWIGRNRLQSLAESAAVDIVAVTDPDESCVRACHEIAPAARALESFEDLLAQDLDALVIATPRALHAQQCLAAFQRGLAVFCQKPLGRNAAEVRSVVEAARRADRLLGVDLSYRWTRAASLARNAVRADRIGRVFHAELIFHNAYGPGKPWFYDRRLAGGGCVIDLGVHLVDLALWTLGFPQIVETRSRLYNKGVLLKCNSAVVEDFATAQLLTDDHAGIALQCSWNLHAGCEAVIAARFYGARRRAHRECQRLVLRLPRVPLQGHEIRGPGRAAGPLVRAGRRGMGPQAAEESAVRSGSRRTHCRRGSPRRHLWPIFNKLVKRETAEARSSR